MAVDMKRCEKCGSFYNAAKESACPFCSGNDMADAGATAPLYTAPINATQSIAQDMEKTVAMTANVASDSNMTQPVIKKKMGIDPVVGWLVCKSGAEKGRDYKIHSENNYIGRSEHMDICIHGDDTISRENHAVITFDDEQGDFYFTPGSGRSIVRLNGKAALMTTELKAYDEIEIGTTQLVFIPLCGPQFKWEAEQPEEA